MFNFRPDKKLKRKNQWKDWRKKKNILDQWWKAEKNRVYAGIESKGRPVEFKKNIKKKRFPLPDKALQSIKLLKRLQKEQGMIKLKWHQKIWNYFLVKKIQWRRRRKK